MFVLETVLTPHATLCFVALTHVHLAVLCQQNTLFQHNNDLNKHKALKSNHDNKLHVYLQRERERERRERESEQECVCVWGGRAAAKLSFMLLKSNFVKQFSKFSFYNN